MGNYFNDTRVSILVRKVLNKIPVNEQPYPGTTIDPNDIDYYEHILAIRNTVSLGREPIEWAPWVKILVDKFTN